MTSNAENPEWRQALEQALGHHFGHECAIASLECRPSPYRSSFLLQEVDVVLKDGTSLPIMFKDLGRQALSREAQQAKPAFLHDPQREIAVYRSILPGTGLGTATCYGSVVDSRMGRYWLFLDRIHGRELYQEGDSGVWQEAARWLAGMHSLHASPQRMRHVLAAGLPRHDSDFLRLWVQRAKDFAPRSQSQLDNSVKAEHLIRRLEACYHQVVDRLAAMPETLIHGEFYASNILVQDTAGGVRICPVDWEMAAVGPGLLDLAALVAGKWQDKQRQAIALAYFDTWSSRSACAGHTFWPSTEPFLADLDWCSLHVAVQWLGWSPNWQPPAEHAQDWLADAVRLAERVGL